MKKSRRLQKLAARSGGNMSLSASSYNGEPAHMGASLTSREISGWNPGNGSADSDLLPDLGILVPRARDIDRNHGVASGLLTTMDDNVVGTGFRLSSTPDYRALGRDKEWAEEWSTNTESKWRAYSETTDIDIAGKLNFRRMTRQIFHAGMLNGESIVLPLWKPSKRGYATKFHVIESDRLSTPWGQLDSASMRGGIEQDEYGRPLAYWIRKAHPGDMFLGAGNLPMFQFERIPAETPWGRKRIIHVHDPERSGQSRAKPILTPVLTQFKMLDHYQRTEMQAAIVNAVVAACIETPLDSQTIAEMFGGDASSPRFASYLAQKNEYRTPLKGGAVIPLFPGDKLSSYAPARPNAAYGPFTENVLRHIGVGANLPYELVMKDFSKTNYSSARAAMLEAWRFFIGRRYWLSNCWCTPAYELWLEEAINKGEIDAPDFYENRYAYSACKWIGAGKGWVDPVKEAQAAQIRMDSCLSTLEDECAEQGRDWEEVLEQRASEIKRMRELGISPPPALVVAPPSHEQQQEQQ